MYGNADARVTIERKARLTRRDFVFGQMQTLRVNRACDVGARVDRNLRAKLFAQLLSFERAALTIRAAAEFYVRAVESSARRRAVRSKLPVQKQGASVRAWVTTINRGQ